MHNLNNGVAEACNWALGVPVGEDVGGGSCYECGMSVFLISGRGMVVRAVKQRITAGRWQGGGGGGVRINKQRGGKPAPLLPDITFLHFELIG